MGPEGPVRIFTMSSPSLLVIFTIQELTPLFPLHMVAGSQSEFGVLVKNRGSSRLTTLRAEPWAPYAEVPICRGSPSELTRYGSSLHLLNVWHLNKCIDWDLTKKREEYFCKFRWRWMRQLHLEEARRNIPTKRIFHISSMSCTVSSRFWHFVSPSVRSPCVHTCEVDRLETLRSVAASAYAFYATMLILKRPWNRTTRREEAC